MSSFVGLAGVLSLLAIAVVFSKSRKDISWRTVTSGLLLQFVFALLVLGVPKFGFQGPLQGVFSWLNDAVLRLLSFADEGTEFLFGPLVDPEKVGGMVVAFKMLPSIIFFSSIAAVLYHVGAMQIIIKAIAGIMFKTMNISAAEALSVAGNIFIGQTEAPLLVKPYIRKMTQSELLTVMTGGMATVSGGVLAAYVQLLKDQIPNIAGHLIAASVMSAPAAIMFAKILLPESEKPETTDIKNISMDAPSTNLIDAAASGASDGMKLAINVGAMLLAFIAIVAMVNASLGSIGSHLGLEVGLGQELSLQYIFGLVFTPLAFLLGIPAEECFQAGQLFGEKIALNEFVAYVSLANMKAMLTQKTMIIVSYALCGFANFASIAIQVGGIGGLAENKRPTLSQLGLRSVLAGSFAAFMTAAIAGILL